MPAAHEPPSPMLEELADALTIVIRTLMPITSSGTFGLARTCTALAEKGMLTQADLIKISFDALDPFDRAIAAGDQMLPPIARALEKLRQSVEAEWDKAMRAAYFAKKQKLAADRIHPAPLV